MQLKASDLAALGICFAGALLAYFALGRPLLADQPYSARMDEIAARAKLDPSQLTTAEALARLEALTREDPDNPTPHAMIGSLMRFQGRDEDAVRAYQSALRRDETYTPALVGWADALVRQEAGAVSAEATRLYGRAYQLDPNLWRAGFMSGAGLAEAGEIDSAERVWAQLVANIPEDHADREEIMRSIEIVRTRYRVDDE